MAWQGVWIFGGEGVKKLADIPCTIILMQTQGGGEKEKPWAAAIHRPAT